MVFILDAVLFMIFSMITINYKISYSFAEKKRKAVDAILEKQINERWVIATANHKKVNATKTLIIDLNKILKPSYNISKAKKDFYILVLLGIIIAVLSVLFTLLLESPSL